MACDTVERLCERIYDAAIDPAAWANALDDFANFAGCAWAALLVRRNDAWTGWSVSPSIATELSSYLKSDSARQSITTDRLFAVDRAGFASDEDLFSKDEYQADVFIRWANAHGFHHGAAAGVRLNNGDLAVVQVMRRVGEQRFSMADLSLLDQFRPHLARAAMLAARWKMERVHAATEALALVGLPAVVLTGDCRVVSANALAEKLTSHLLWLANDHLALADRAASTKLQEHVSKCATAGSIYSASSFPTWDVDSKAPVVVHVVPLNGNRRELFNGGLVLSLFTPVGSQAQPDCNLIRELFDLTAAEARVAAHLASGRSIDEIAGAHHVSVSTVRSQAKAILQKIGAHRQAELAARLGGAGALRPMITHT